jgi:hypothetical protein
MCEAPRQVPPPTSPLCHLQHARRVLVNKLPAEHDLRKRVQVDGKGELLPDQPAGRPITPPKAPSARKRVREPNEPTKVLKQHLLTIMWNEKYHLQEEWDRVHAKMAENRKKLGMRERPYKKSDSRERSGRESSDSSSKQGSEPAAKQPAKKRRKSVADWPGAGDRNLGCEPNQKKRRQLDSERRDREACEHQSASREDRVAPQKSDQSLVSSGSSDEEQLANKGYSLKSLQTQTRRNLPQSLLRTSSQIAEVPDGSLLGNGTLPLPSFPTVAEVLDAIPASGISMLRMTALFRDRVNKDMDKFHTLLYSNANIEADNRLIRRRVMKHEDGQLAVPVAECGGAEGYESFRTLSTSDETGTACGDGHSGHGIAIKTRAVHPRSRLLARRGGLNTIRNRKYSKSTRRKRRRYADDVDL